MDNIDGVERIERSVDDLELVWENARLQIWGSMGQTKNVTLTFFPVGELERGAGTISGTDVGLLIVALTKFVVGERHYVTRGTDSVVLFHPSCGGADDCPYGTAFDGFTGWGDVPEGEWTIGLGDHGQLTIVEPRVVKE